MTQILAYMGGICMIPSTALAPQHITTANIGSTCVDYLDRDASTASTTAAADRGLSTVYYPLNVIIFFPTRGLALSIPEHDGFTRCSKFGLPNFKQQPARATQSSFQRSIG